MGLDVPARAEIYIPYRQIATQPWFTPRDLVVRTAGNPTDALDAITGAVHAIDPALAISNIRPLDEVLDEEVASRRVGTTLLISFAAFALVLAVVGLYGVIAYFVAQHVPEIGVRIALGAQPGDILRFVISRGMSLALAGVALGTLAAIALPRLMTSLLYGATGGAVIGLAASLLLLLLSLLATYLPGAPCHSPRSRGGAASAVIPRSDGRRTYLHAGSLGQTAWQGSAPKMPRHSARSRLWVSRSHAIARRSGARHVHTVAPAGSPARG